MVVKLNDKDETKPKDFERRPSDEFISDFELSSNCLNHLNLW